MTTAVATRAPTPMAEALTQLDTMSDQFRAALPAHIPPERFARVVRTAIQNSPDLINKADRRSLWNAAMRAAQDGLLPDGRDGAIVLYGNQAQWMVMIGGLRKKVRNSGEIATWDVYVVHRNDHFQFRLGDDPFIEHVPVLEGEPGPVIGAYSIAVLKTGEKSREYMSVSAIEKVRTRSKAKNSGPWITDYEEMCRKTVARRHSKVLPMSTDLDDLIRRDDDLYDFEGARAEAQAERAKTLSGKLDAISHIPSTESPEIAGGTVDPDTGEVTDAAESTSPQSPTDSAVGQAAPEPKSSQGRGKGAAKAASADAEEAPGDFTPETEAQYQAYANAWREASVDPTEAKTRWNAEKSMRNKCNVSAEVRDELKSLLEKKIADIEDADKY